MIKIAFNTTYFALTRKSGADKVLLFNRLYAEQRLHTYLVLNRGLKSPELAFLTEAAVLCTEPLFEGKVPWFFDTTDEAKATYDKLRYLYYPFASEVLHGGEDTYPRTGEHTTYVHMNNLAYLLDFQEPLVPQIVRLHEAGLVPGVVMDTSQNWASQKPISTSIEVFKEQLEGLLQTRVPVMVHLQPQRLFRGARFPLNPGLFQLADFWKNGFDSDLGYMLSPLLAIANADKRDVPLVIELHPFLGAGLNPYFLLKTH